MIAREHFICLAPHARHVRRALEVGAVSRRPDVVLRLQLPPAALRERLEYVAMRSELARLALIDPP